MAVETRVVSPEVPGDLLMCDVPAPEHIKLDSDVADYMVQLHNAATTCARNMQAVRAIVVKPQ